MNEFVNCIILGVFIKKFIIKIAIELSKNHCDLIITVGFDLSQNNRYIFDISDNYRYISNIYRYFIYIFLKISTRTNVRYIFDILSKYRKIPIFRRNIGDFTNF